MLSKAKRLYFNAKRTGKPITMSAAVETSIQEVLKANVPIQSTWYLPIPVLSKESS